MRWRQNLRQPKKGWQGSDKTAVGLVVSRREDKCIIVRFPGAAEVRVIAEASELVLDADGNRIHAGVLVYIRSSVVEPAFGWTILYLSRILLHVLTPDYYSTRRWGEVDRHMVGMVKTVDSNGEVNVDFGNRTPH